jgi:adenine-specific DNA-methyltransferase
MVERRRAETACTRGNALRDYGIRTRTACQRWSSRGSRSSIRTISRCRFANLWSTRRKAFPAARKASLDDNLIIHGDNLEALKALLPRYAGKVDVIYIDPPYNTGNEGWTFNDNVNSPLMKEWLGKVVDRDDLERHDKWLCMMWPRLQLLFELLAEHGSLWISCDDNEAHHLRTIVEEIAGPAAFIDSVVWQKNYSPKSTANQFSSDHDYILVFSKADDKWRPGLLPRTAEQDAAYENLDNDPRGDWKPGDLSARNPYSKGIYPITTPSGRIIPGPPPGNFWRVSEDRLKKLDADKRIWWGEDGSNVPAVKRFLKEVKPGRVPQTLWLYKDVGHTQEAKQELFDIMDWREGTEKFQTPKPVRLIERILAIASDVDSVVMDSFAGSGTTAHAVLVANARDDGNRRFILVETEEYADALTAERLRRVVKGVPNARKEALKHGVGGSFTYCELGEPIDLERFFDGKGAPSYEQVGRYVVYTATGASISQMPSEPKKNWFVTEAGGYRIHLIYKPDLAFMRGTDAALSIELAKDMNKAAKGKPVLVYAAAKFMSQAALTAIGITFCQLPYSIHRVLGEAPDAP